MSKQGANPRKHNSQSFQVLKTIVRKNMHWRSHNALGNSGIRNVNNIVQNRGITLIRRAIALSCSLVCVLVLQWVLLCLPAQAETWVMVAKSDTTNELQYVDADSIESLGSVIRLKTYWGFLDQPNSINYATTDYRCETEEYRDVIVNGEQTKATWTSVGSDTLNRAAMEYGCQHNRG